MPSVYIKTYGCQMNERDSEAVAAQLVAKGYTLAASEAGADVVLLNTCSVRDAAEQKAIGKMQNLAAEVRKNRPVTSTDRLELPMRDAIALERRLAERYKMISAPLAGLAQAREATRSRLAAPRRTAGQ